MIKLSLKFEVSLSQLAFVIVGSAACYGISRCVSNWISSDEKKNDKDATDTQENDKDATNQHSHKPENKMKIKNGHPEKNQAASTVALGHLVPQNNYCMELRKLALIIFQRMTWKI